MAKFLFFMSAFLLSVCSLSAELLEQANHSYQQGVQASTLLERERAFNQALKLYMEVASNTSAPSSQLYQAIANTYFELNEYAWSLLYNYKALKLDPQNGDILQSIQSVKSRLGLDTASVAPSFITREMLISILFILLLITFICCSFFIWFRYLALKKLSIILSTLALLLLFFLMLDYYFSPIEGVLVTSTGYYREPDVHQAQLTSLPLKAGTKLRVIAIDKHAGGWIKTADTNGLIGYIPASAIRII